jgi:hypothetical protein
MAKEISPPPLYIKIANLYFINLKQATAAPSQK